MKTKTCAKCGHPKPLDQFHKQPSGPQGRHSYCKDCANKVQRESRERHDDPKRKRRWTLKARYGLTPEQVDVMLLKQKGLCAICAKEPKKACVDHDHKTGKVRGILCHRCNIGLPYVEEMNFRISATRYLEAF